jgi:GT2 family glycosyltransferase
MVCGPKPSVYVVVLNWRHADETAACLDALARIDYPNTHIVVVNNGSADALRAAVEPRLGRIKLLQNERNLGYTGGCNVGIEHALGMGADFIWLLNADARPEPDCLTKLVAAITEEPGVGLVSPVIRYRDRPELIESGAGRFNPASCSWAWFESDVVEQLAKTDPRHIMLDGTALLLDAAVARRIGLLDDDLFAYHETIDYSMRAQAAGFRLKLVVDATVYHRPEPSDVWPPYVAYYVTRNEMLMWRKHAPRLLRWKASYWHLRRTIAQLKGEKDPEVREARMAGWWHGEIGVTGEWDPRRRAPLLVRWLLRTCPLFVLTRTGRRKMTAPDAPSS